VDTRHPRAARRWFLVTAALAWLGLAVSLTLDIVGPYPSTTTDATRYGYAVPMGFSGAGARVADWVCYFTIWSNIVVAVVSTVLARRPDRDGRVMRVVRLDSVLMISVTALVYAVVLAPSAVQRGWENVSNSLLHQVTPALAVLGWVLVGPRRRVSWPVVAGALGIPVAWIGLMLARGAATGSYPYPFVDVARLGYGTVLVNLAGVLALGVAAGALYLGADRLLSRRQPAGTRAGAAALPPPAGPAAF
jgi:hypothetical protein